MTFVITEQCRGCGLCPRYCPTGAIRGERRQLYVIDPRLCVECGACGRICAFGAVLDGDGQPVAHLKSARWPRPVWALRVCVACNICVQACPAGVIGTVAGEGKVGHARYPVLADAEHCLGCAICAAACPVDAIQMVAAGPPNDGGQKITGQSSGAAAVRPPNEFGVCYAKCVQTHCRGRSRNLLAAGLA